MLGMQWLSTMGDVKCNFVELRMEFFRGKSKVVLRGAKQPAVSCLSKKKM